MRRMLLGLAFGLGYVSLASAQQVDFDRLFMAASGSSLPEPPAQPADPNAAPELTPAPAGKPDEGLLPKPQGAGTSQVPSLQAPSLQAPSLQAPALQRLRWDQPDRFHHPRKTLTN